MVTKEDIMKLDKKGIETLFNSFISGLTITNLEPAPIKRAMFEEINKNLVGFQLSNHEYTNNTASFSTDRFGFLFKLGVKSTGKIIPVSKLKSKLVKGVGKIKLDSITFGFTQTRPDFELEDPKTLKVCISKTSSIYGNFVNNMNVTNMSGPIRDMYSQEKMMEMAHAQKQDNIDKHNKYRRDKKDHKDNYRGLRYDIGLSMAQPIIKKHLGIIWDSRVTKSKLSFIPKEYRPLIPNDLNHTNAFETIVQVILHVNSDLVDSLINDLFPDTCTI
jgi:hypothetical protein